ncbi:MAG: nodulation protein NfeD [Elusimicrobia bacterium]|nr:nodulation protein NfeD [Elusimicrobiota bacterium]
MTALLIWVSISFSFAQKPQEYEVKNIVVATFSGVISPVSAEYINQAIDKANSGKFDMLVVRLDTPGGLDLSMRSIIKKILGSSVPIAMYVSPKGARAASAGVFISMASHIAAMSPGTNIGAAHPVMMGKMPSKDDKKENSSDMEEKILNDASAYIKSITQSTGRNVQWAIKAVEKSDSLSAEEAVRDNVVDFMADDLDDLISKINGRKVKDFGIIKINSPVFEYYEQTDRQKFLATITDPNIAMILMSLGAAGLFIELYNPGLIFPGVIGAVSLVIAFYSFQTLSANFAGIALMLLGFLFFVVEIKVVSYGLLTISGIVSIILGALMLFDQSSLGGMSISMSILSTTILGLVAIVAVLTWLVVKAHMKRIVTGSESLDGKKGLVKTALSPSGKVLIEGELWDAVSIEGDIPKNAEVVVQSVKGFKIKVKKA